MSNKAVLYICPTPIGNLEDITLRALRILKEVDFIACEDTRVTQKLLNHFDIKTKLISYHKFSEREKTEEIIKLLKSGHNIALVSDAGTPLISYPGGELLKQAYYNGIKVEPLPGASAITTALSGSTLSSSHFVFLGFLPRDQKGKEAMLESFSDLNIVFYESPHRLVETLKELEEIYGERNAVIARELTKIHEELRHDTLKNLYQHYEQNPPKGEITVIIEGIAKEKVSKEEKELLHQIKLLKEEGFSSRDIAKIVSLLNNMPKKLIYELVLANEK